MYIWVRSRNCFLFASTRVHPLFVGEVCVAHYLGFCVVLLRVIAFWVPRCGVCCDFHVDAMFRLSLPPVVCRSASVLFPLFGLFVSSTCCVECLFCFSSSCCQFLLLSMFWLSFRYPLSFIPNPMLFPFRLFIDKTKSRITCSFILWFHHTFMISES